MIQLDFADNSCLLKVYSGSFSILSEDYSDSFLDVLNYLCVDSRKLVKLIEETVRDVVWEDLFAYDTTQLPRNKCSTNSRSVYFK